MYQLAHAADHRRLIHILSALEENDAGIQLLLFVGNGDYSDLLGEGSVSVSESAPAILADLTLDTRVRRDSERGPVSLKADIDGILVPLLSGSISQPEYQEDFSCKLIAASSGGLLNKVRLVPSNTTRHVTEFASWTPERVIRNAVMRCAGVGGYDPGGIYIQRIGAPLLNYVGDDAFEDTAKCWDVLDKISKQLSLLYRDTPDNGFEAINAPLAGEGNPSVWDYETTSTQVLKWSPPMLKAPDEQYSDVLVRKREDDGSYSAIGYAKVTYFHTAYALHIDQTLVIDYPDPLDSQAASRARRMAFDQARLIGRGVYKGEPVVSFNPLLQKGDLITFREDYVDEKGRWRRVWHAVITAYKHVFKEGIETDLTCDFYLVEEELLAPPSTAGKKAARMSVGVTIPGIGPLAPRPALAPSPTLAPRP